MTQSSRKSIRRYLLASLIIAQLVGSLIIAVFIYVNAAEEIDELYDKNMEEIAETLKSQLSSLNLDAHYGRGTVGPSLRAEIKAEQEFLVQIWDKDRVSVYSSHGEIPYPFQESSGMQINAFQDQLWRSYGTRTDQLVIQVSQPQKARNLYVREMVQHLLLPLLSFMPVVCLLIWLAVGRSLTPLHEISDAITKRSAISLEPISEENIPVEVQPLVQELNELLMRLNTSLAAQRSFTADAAHQLRTPLTALQLQLANLKRAKSDAEREQNAAKLQNGIDRAAKVVQQLLTLARVEPNGVDAQKSPIALLPLLQELVKQYAELAVAKNIDLAMTRQEPTTVHGSPENLRILFDNLLGNALHYTPRDGKVNVNLYSDSGRAIIEIQDNGIGIPASDRDRIFERFHRVLGTETEGTGLGLSIAQNIIEQHNGSIQVGNGIDDQGTCFTVSLPCPGQA